MLQNGIKDFAKGEIQMITNLVFRLLKWLLVKNEEDDLITDICEELLELSVTDKFIVGRSNCPICGDPFYPGEWDCHCFDEEDQDTWFRFIDHITFMRKGYSHSFYVREENNE